MDPMGYALQSQKPVSFLERLEKFDSDLGWISRWFLSDVKHEATKIDDFEKKKGTICFLMIGPTSKSFMCHHEHLTQHFCYLPSS